MKVVQFDEHGASDVLHLATRSRPEPGPGEALVRVDACGVNRMDTIVRAGPSGIDVGLPHVPGAEIVGEVVETGRDATSFEPGETVARYPGVYCGDCPACADGRHPHCSQFDVVGRKEDGGYAEFVLAPDRDLLSIPGSVEPTRAATLPIAFTTAWRMLRTKAALDSSDVAVVLGATGDVGLAALAIADTLGVTTLATTRSDSRVDPLESAGADRVVVTDGEEFSRDVQEFTDGVGADLVVDYLGRTSWSESIKSVRKGGTITACGHLTGYDATTDLRYVTWREIALQGSTLGTRAEFESALAFAFDRDVHLPVADVFDLSDAASAHRMVEADGGVGKVVLDVSGLASESR